MNEQIAKIAKQAGLTLSVDQQVAFQRAAELIVRECLKELRYTVVDTQECRQDKSTDYQVGWEDGMFDAGETIKQHFGVE